MERKVWNRPLESLWSIWEYHKALLVSLSLMYHGILGHDHIQWHPQLIRDYTNLWTYYRTWPFYWFWPYYQISGVFHRKLQQVRLANRGRLLLRTPGPVPFGTCICSDADTIFSWACHVLDFEFRTYLGTSILLILQDIDQSRNHVAIVASWSGRFGDGR